MSVVKDNLKMVAEMEDEEFIRWQLLLEQRSGVWIPQHRKAFLITKLLIRMRELSLRSFREYYNRLASGDWAAIEWAHLVDLLTVHETRFCRDMDGLRLVREHCSHLLDKDRRKKGLELWSVGCSTGEEVYSLGMTVADLLSSYNHRTIYFGVTGTDISFPALAEARRAIYHHRKMVHLKQEWVYKYTIERDDGQFEISPGIKDRACFVQGNIKDLEQAPSHKYDIIYCQNVLIYFQPPQRIKVLNNLANRLEAGGLLVLAPGEITHWDHPWMLRIDDKNCLSFIRRE